MTDGTAVSVKGQEVVLSIVAATIPAGGLRKDMEEETAGPKARENMYDAIIVGAGFAGLYALHRLLEMGLSVRVLEAGDDIGGTWYWNRYPGARCDVESMQYSFSFSEELQQEWRWSEVYATQPEILRYINHVADRFDLRKDIQLKARVTSASFDEVENHWTIMTQSGEAFVAPICIMATGCLSEASLPNIPGRDSFNGTLLRTANWPHDEVDFSGRRVGVIGTGSSGIQAIPPIAQSSESLVVFQRTPNFSVPARNKAMTQEHEQFWKSNYKALRRFAREDTRTGTLHNSGTRSALEVGAQDRRREYEARWAKGGTGFLHAFSDLNANPEANATAADFVRKKIAEIVADPRTAEMLMPRDHAIGTKRICVDSEYYATFNRDNVTLVNIRETPIKEIVPEGVRTSDRLYELEILVFATGFDAITGALLKIDISGRNGVKLSDKWAAGPRTYLGLMTAGFPNLFTITGPGSPSVLSNVIVSIEQHVDWIADCLRYMSTSAYATIEAEVEAEESWVAHVNDVASNSLHSKANSWYLGANIPGKPRVFMPYIGVDKYRRRCNEISAFHYTGFRLTPASSPASATTR